MDRMAISASHKVLIDTSLWYTGASTLSNQQQAKIQDSKWVIPDKYVDNYRLPMSWGLSDKTTDAVVLEYKIRAQDVPGPGYHWYKTGRRQTIGPAHQVYFFWYRLIQQDMDSVYDADNPDQLFDIWARIKFEGPSFPHAEPGDRDAICVERVVVVKAEW